MAACGCLNCSCESTKEQSKTILSQIRQVDSKGPNVLDEIMKELSILNEECSICYDNAITIQTQLRGVLPCGEGPVNVIKQQPSGGFYTDVLDLIRSITTKVRQTREVVNSLT